jgi:aminomethyltransferase
MSKRTPLHAAHLEAQARMVDFGGWDMPVNYGSQIEEHHAVRTAAGMFDVSHMRVLDLAGSDVRVYLQRLLANNVAKLTTIGKALYSCMLNAGGGVIDDLIVYWQGDEGSTQRFRVVVNAGTADADVAWMRSQAQDFDVAITERIDLAMIAVQGPLARSKVWEVIPGSQAATADLKPFQAAAVVAAPWGELYLARTGYTGEDGFEIIVPAVTVHDLWNALRQAGVAPCGLGARDTLRLEAGMALYGNDLSETVTPFESGLSWTVDLRAPRAFIGRDALENGPSFRTMVGLLLLDKGVLRAHYTVQTSMGDGEITSGTFSPTLQRSIALARVPVGVYVGDTVHAQVRGHSLACRVTSYPFVRHGKALIEV